MFLAYRYFKMRDFHCQMKLWTCSVSFWNPGKTLAHTASFDNEFHKSISPCGKNFLFLFVMKLAHTELVDTGCVWNLLIAVFFDASYLLDLNPYPLEHCWFCTHLWHLPSVTSFLNWADLFCWDVLHFLSVIILSANLWTLLVSFWRSENQKFTVSSCGCTIVLIGTVLKGVGSKAENNIVTQNKNFNLNIFFLTDNTQFKAHHHFIYGITTFFLCITWSSSTGKLKCYLLSCHIFSEALFNIGPLFCYSK